MHKEAIIEILNDWNLWKKDIDTGIDRDEYLERVDRALGTGQVAVITGVRRSGKSTKGQRRNARSDSTNWPPKSIEN